MKVSVPSAPQDPRRRMPRHATDAVACPLGELLDLSGTGMRVAVKGRCPLKVGQRVPMRLKTPQGAVPVTVEIVWRKRTGLLGNYELGCRFDGLKPNLAVALATIARFGFIPAEDVKAAGASSPTQRPASDEIPSNTFTAKPSPRNSPPRNSPPRNSPPRNSPPRKPPPRNAARPATASGPASVEASLVLAPYFEVLGLASGASRDQIKSAYRQRARQYHPDVAPGEENRRKFLEMREAYDLLMDHARRAG